MIEMERRARQRMYAFRNGIVADTLRRAGLPHEVIFGLNLPQITAIAKDIRKETEAGAAARGEAGAEEVSAVGAHELGLRLWADEKCREARLLALRLLDPAMTDSEMAARMAGSVRSREEADVMRLWLLSKMEENTEADRILADKGYPAR